MIIKIYFRGHSETFTSFSEWHVGDAIGTAVLSELFRRFPDTVQNVSGTSDRVDLRTVAPMPTEWLERRR